MPIHERRHHFRVDDHIHFDYHIIHANEAYTEEDIKHMLLGEQGLRCIETSQYFREIDRELAHLTEKLSIKEPALAHYLNLLNAKIDFISRNITSHNKSNKRKVNISLGGMAFKTPEKIKEKTPIKIIIYTKPNMVPIIVDSTVIYSQYQNENHYHTAVDFIDLTQDQEQLLSQHIIQAQIKMRAD